VQHFVVNHRDETFEIPQFLGKHKMARDDHIDDSSDPEAAKNARITRNVNKVLAAIAWSIGIALLLSFCHIFVGID